MVTGLFHIFMIILHILAYYSRYLIMYYCIYVILNTEQSKGWFTPRNPDKFCLRVTRDRIRFNVLPSLSCLLKSWKKFGTKWTFQPFCDPSDFCITVWLSMPAVTPHQIHNNLTSKYVGFKIVFNPTGFICKKSVCSVTQNTLFIQHYISCSESTKFEQKALTICCINYIDVFLQANLKEDGKDWQLLTNPSKSKTAFLSGVLYYSTTIWG